MNARSRRRAAQLTGLLMVAGLAAGCSSDEPAETTAEVAEEERPVQAGTDELPETWPSSVPLPEDYEVTTFTTSGTGDDASHTAVLTVPHTFEETLAEMKQGLVDSEWAAASPEMESTTDDVDSWQQLYTADDVQMVVSIRALDEGVSVALSTSPVSD